GAGFADDVEVLASVHGSASSRLITIAPHQGREEEPAEVGGEDDRHGVAAPFPARLDSILGQREIRRCGDASEVAIAEGVDGNSFRTVRPSPPDKRTGEQPRAVGRQLGDKDVVHAAELALEGSWSSGK